MEIGDLLGRVPRLSERLQQEAFQTHRVGSFADRLYTVRPKNILAAIAIPPRPERDERAWLRIVTITTGYRSAFAAIHVLAESLAPTVRELGIVPVIQPIKDDELTALAVDSRIVTVMTERGAVLYDYHAGDRHR